MSTAGPDPDKVYEAWRLKVEEEMSLRAIGQRLGVSHVTAGDWVQRGYQAEAWGTVLDRHAQRGAMTAQFDAVIGWLLGQLRSDDHRLDDKLAIIDRLFRGSQLKAQLNGLNMPARIEVTDAQASAARDAFANDPTLIAVREKQRQRNEYDDAELRAGRPGVIAPREEWTG